MISVISSALTASPVLAKTLDDLVLKAMTHLFEIGAVTGYPTLQLMVIGYENSTRVLPNHWLALPYPREAIQKQELSWKE